MKTSTQNQTPRTLPAPGSWYASPNSDRFGSWDIYTKSGSYHIGDATAPHGAASARDHCTLAAAAPDLLDALRPLLFEVEQILISTQHFPECAVKCSRRAAVELARAALAKATGGAA